MRFGQLSRRTLLQTALAALLALGIPALTMAQGKGGGGKGGGGDNGGDSTPPPMTYMIQRFDDFVPRGVNNDGDIIGTIPSLAGTGSHASTFGLIYGGRLEVMERLFIGTGAAPRVLNDLSNRLDDGSLHLCGSCETVDGIRGWRMKVFPSQSGLERVSFAILEPAEGDDVSAISSINIRGESVGYSYARTGDSSRVYATLYQSDETTLQISPTGTIAHFITDMGEVIGQFEPGDGTTQIGSWSPGNSLQILLNTATLSVDDLGLTRVSDTGAFLVEMYEEHTSRKNSYWVTTTYLYDGELHYLADNADDSNVRIWDLNTQGDLLSTYFRSGKGSNPGRHIYEYYFADLGVMEELDNMIDPTNDQEHIDLWFGASPSCQMISDSGLIVGVDAIGTFILIPVSL